MVERRELDARALELAAGVERPARRAARRGGARAGGRAGRARGRVVDDAGAARARAAHARHSPTSARATSRLAFAGRRGRGGERGRERPARRAADRGAASRRSTSRRAGWRGRAGRPGRDRQGRGARRGAGGVGARRPPRDRDRGRRRDRAAARRRRGDPRDDDRWTRSPTAIGEGRLGLDDAVGGRVRRGGDGGHAPPRRARSSDARGATRSCCSPATRRSCRRSARAACSARSQKRVPTARADARSTARGHEWERDAWARCATATPTGRSPRTRPAAACTSHETARRGRRADGQRLGSAPGRSTRGSAS